MDDDVVKTMSSGTGVSATVSRKSRAGSRKGTLRREVRRLSQDEERVAMGPDALSEKFCLREAADSFKAQVSDAAILQAALPPPPWEAAVHLENPPATPRSGISGISNGVSNGISHGDSSPLFARRGGSRFHTLLQQLGDEHERVLHEVLVADEAERSRLLRLSEVSSLMPREPSIPSKGSAQSAPEAQVHRLKVAGASDSRVSTAPAKVVRSSTVSDPCPCRPTPPSRPSQSDCPPADSPQVLGVKRTTFCLTQEGLVEGESLPNVPWISDESPVFRDDTAQSGEEDDNEDREQIIADYRDRSPGSQLSIPIARLSGSGQRASVPPPMTCEYPLRKLWENNAAMLKQSPSQSSRKLIEHSGAARLSNMTWQATDTGMSTVSVDLPWMWQFMLDPSSPKKLAWDLIGGMFILYDLVNIPLLVFDPPVNVFTITMGWTSLVFWTLNMFASVSQGYVDDGRVIMEPWKVIKKYFRFWFWVDLLVVVPDWVFTVMAAINNAQGGVGGNSVKLLRILRLGRVLRLLRLLKLGRTLATINDWLDSEYASIVVNIVKMIFCLLIINHLIACAWWLVGLMRDDSWILFYEFNLLEWRYQYATAFHWSITQFTPASMDIQPQNLTERAFAIHVVIFALVGFSYLVGSITGSLTQLRAMQEEATKEFWNLRRYLRRNRVPAPLTIRIQKYLEHEYQRQHEGHSSSKVKIISLLSDQLQKELRCAMSVPHMLVHPLMEHLNDEHDVTVQRLAYDAVAHKFFATGDPVFFPAEVSTSAYFVVNGRLQYKKKTDGIERREWVDKGEDWISEPTLWTPAWIHLGFLCATSVGTELLLVSPSKFAEIISLNPTTFKVVAGYAERFMEWINNTPVECLSDILQGDLESDSIRGFIELDKHHASKMKALYASKTRNKKTMMKNASVIWDAMVAKDDADDSSPRSVKSNKSAKSLKSNLTMWRRS